MYTIETLTPWLDQYSSTLPAQNRYAYSNPGTLLPAELQTYCSAVSLMVRMNPQSLKGVMPHGPTEEYHEEHSRCTALLATWAEATAAQVTQAGHAAFAITDHPALSHKAHAPSHRAIAVKAGMGWIGRSALLVTRDWGPRIRLATVLTTLPCGDYKPVALKSFCASCSRCVRACPAKALYGEIWQQGTAYSTLLNSVRCREWKISQYPKFNGESCGICEAVCPYGHQ